MNRLFVAILLFTTAGLSACGTEDTDPPVPPAPVLTPADDLRFTRSTIDDDANGPAFAEVADVDGDGREDVIISQFGLIQGTAISPGSITIYYQGKDLGDWSRTEQVFSPEDNIYWPNELTMKDIDGDGDLDLAVGMGFLICAFLPRIDTMGQQSPAQACGGLLWFEQTSAGWQRHDIITPTTTLFYHKPVIVDFDGDGILDIVAVGEERPPEGPVGDRAVAQWFKGTNTPNRFETLAREIGVGMGSLPTVLDLDGDGDLDLASAEFFTGLGGSFAWYERVGEPSLAFPAGRFVRHVIDDEVGPSIQLSFIDNLLGDGQLVAIGSVHTNTTVTPPEPWESAVYLYTIPSDPRERWNRRKISENIVSVPVNNQAAPGIFGWGDADGDNDLDILLSGDGDRRVFILENTGAGNFNTMVLENELTQAGAMKIHDLDGDGRAELLVSGYDDSIVYLYRSDVDGTPLQPAQLPEWAGPVAGTEVIVNYDGEANGPLILAIFDSWPPAGPPRNFQKVENPSFPARVTMPFTDEGSYQLMAYIDADASGDMGPNEPDPQLISPINLPVAGPITIDLTGGSVGPAPEPTSTSVSVLVDYDGPERGTVVVAAFESLPVMGPPMTFTIVENVQDFPITVMLEDVPGPACQILAFLDLEPFNPTFPSDTDPVVESEIIELGGGLIETSVTIQGR